MKSIKKEINAVFASLEPSIIKISTSYGEYKTHPDTGRSKAVYCGSISPMDCFNKAMDNAAAKMRTIRDAVVKLGAPIECESSLLLQVVASETKTKRVLITFATRRVSSYSAHCGMDSGYQQVIITKSVREELK